MDEGSDAARDGKIKAVTEGQKRKQRKYEDMLRRAGVNVAAKDLKETLGEYLSCESSVLSNSPVFASLIWTTSDPADGFSIPPMNADRYGFSIPAKNADRYKITNDDPYQISSLPYVHLNNDQVCEMKHSSGFMLLRASERP